MRNINRVLRRNFKYWFTPFAVIGGGYIAWLYLVSPLKESPIAPLIFFALGMLFAVVMSKWFPEKVS